MNLCAVHGVPFVFSIEFHWGKELCNWISERKSINQIECRSFSHSPYSLWLKRMHDNTPNRLNNINSTPYISKHTMNNVKCHRICHFDILFPRTIVSCAWKLELKFYCGKNWHSIENKHCYEIRNSNPKICQRIGEENAMSESRYGLVHFRYEICLMFLFNVVDSRLQNNWNENEMLCLSLNREPAGIHQSEIFCGRALTGEQITHFDYVNKPTEIRVVNLWNVRSWCWYKIVRLLRIATFTFLWFSFITNHLQSHIKFFHFKSFSDYGLKNRNG